MTPEVALITAIRIAGSLPVLRWPLGGGLLAVLVDLSDLLLRDLLGLGSLDYQAWDKWVDQLYLAAFLVVALRWTGMERTVAIGLYAFRLVGFAAFEITGDRGMLLLFPNVFELWFLFVAALHHFRPGFRLRSAQVIGILVVLLAIKELHEWALHGARLFDGISSLEAIDLLRRSVTGD